MNRLYNNCFSPPIEAGVYNNQGYNGDSPFYESALSYYDHDDDNRRNNLQVQQQYLQINNVSLPYYRNNNDDDVDRLDSPTSATPPSVLQSLLKRDVHNSVMQMDVSPSTSGIGGVTTPVMTQMPMLSRISVQNGLLQQHPPSSSASVAMNMRQPPYCNISNVTVKSEPLTTAGGHAQVKNEPLDFGGKFNNNNVNNNNNCHNNIVKYEHDSSTPQSSAVGGADQKPNICAGCNRHIVDRYMLKADDKVWHEDCLRCHECRCKLTEKDRSLFLKNNKIYCRNDYNRLFVCSVCRTIIPPKDLIMRAGGNVYHLNCFACQECEHRFCVGDRFYFDFDNNKILCEYHQHERTYFAGLSNCNSPMYLAQLKRQFSCQMDDLDEMMPPIHR